MQPPAETRLTTKSPLSSSPQLDSWMCLTPVSFPVLRSSTMGIVATRALKGGRWGEGGAGGREIEREREAEKEPRAWKKNARAVSKHTISKRAFLTTVIHHDTR